MIGGNKMAELQVRTPASFNDIGERINTWETVQTLRGFLDLQGGQSNYNTFNTKLQESTHIFIGDYVEITAKAEESRLVIDGKNYDVVLIDNPMELNKHIEIYLKFTGGQ